MLSDRYGNSLNTSSQAARDAYVDGLDRFLAVQDGVEEAFERAIAEDPNFALAHIGLARQHHVWGNGDAVAAPLEAARACTGLSDVEQSHVHTFDLLMTGRVKEGYAAARAHVIDTPRDALVASTCLGVFSLIGFSGQPGREAECLALSTSLAPAYGNDWWFMSQHAFAQMEAGQVGPAATSIETAIAGNPRNANASHIRSHLYYENGETEAGLAYLRDWMPGYAREALMHCHLSWHVALWALEQGDIDLMWAVIDADITPVSTKGPALNVLTDMASILYRAELRGVEVPPARWTEISQYATEYFPKAGLAFADVHAALAHAMSGDTAALSKIIETARGPAGDVVRALAQAFEAIAAQHWAEAETYLAIGLRDHARIGGSRAQRDMLEFAMVSVMLRQGRGTDAKRMLSIRRPLATHAGSVLN